MSTNTINDGGPAFPFEEVKERYMGVPSRWENHTGASLRDYFAAAALQGLLSDNQTLAATQENMPIGSCVAREIANAAYDAADAMMKARENKAP